MFELSSNQHDVELNSWEASIFRMHLRDPAVALEAPTSLHSAERLQANCWINERSIQKTEASISFYNSKA